ncbi:hypothetical protein FK425_RS03000 [Enterococcus hirae]
MSDFYFVKLRPEVYNDLITSKETKNRILNKETRMYLAFEQNERNWYIPFKAHTSTKHPDSVFFLPILEEDPHLVSPGLVFYQSLNLSSSDVIEVKIKSEEIADLYLPFIEKNLEKIKDAFYHYLRGYYNHCVYDKKTGTLELFLKEIEEICNLKFNEGISDKSIQNLSKRGDIKGIEAYREKQLPNFLEEDYFIKFLSVKSHLPWQDSSIIQILIAQKPDVQLALQAWEWKKLEKKLNLCPESLLRAYTGEVFKKKTNSKPTDYFQVQVFDVSELKENQEIPRPAYYVGDQTVDSFLYKILFQSIRGLTSRSIEIQSGMNDKEKLSILLRSAIHKRRWTSIGDQDHLEYFKSEAVGYTLAKHLGLSTESYSFEYLSTLRQNKLSETTIDNILESISSEVNKTYNDFIEKFNIILNKSNEKNKVTQLKNNQSIEILDPVNKGKKRREALIENSKKKFSDKRLKVGEKQQRDPQTWTEVKTKKSKRIHPNIYESKTQNSEGQNSENNSEYWWEIESKHVRKVKEGNHQLSGDSKGLIRPEVKISLEKTEGASIKKTELSMDIKGNEQQTVHIKGSNGTKQQEVKERSWKENSSTERNNQLDNLEKYGEANQQWFEKGTLEKDTSKGSNTSTSENVVTNDLKSSKLRTFEGSIILKAKEGASLPLSKAEDTNRDESEHSTTINRINPQTDHQESSTLKTFASLFNMKAKEGESLSLKKAEDTNRTESKLSTTINGKDQQTDHQADQSESEEMTWETVTRKGSKKSNKSNKSTLEKVDTNRLSSFTTDKNSPQRQRIAQEKATKNNR